MSYKFTELAKSDLRAIYIYSLRQFGEPAADKYLAGLYAMFEAIGRNPRMGQKPDFDTDHNIEKFPAFKHVIYYSIASDNITIRRIFHGSREIDDWDIAPFE